MIRKIIELSIQKSTSTLLITLFLSLIGLYNAYHLSIDAVPDVTNIQVSLVTQAPGLSPLEVEQFITYPVELALNGLPFVTEIRSISRTGVSSVTVIFEDHVNIYFARQLVNERIKLAEADIPIEYGKPELSPIATGLGDIYEFTLMSDRHSPEELRTYMEWEIYRVLKSVPGVIDLNILGGEARQYQIIIDPKRIMSHQLTLSKILEKIKESNVNVGGGYIEKGNEQMVIRAEGKFSSILDLEMTAVKTDIDGTPLYLGQIANIKTGPALRFGVCTKDGKGEVVGATVMMLMGRNSREVVQSVIKEMEKVKENLPVGMRIETFYNRSEFINKTLSTVFLNLFEGALLVFVILIFLLGSVKGAVIVASAIPVSMLITTIFMRAFGVVGNLMSLGALDFGLLVDGSIVMLESILTGFIANKSLFDSLSRPSQIKSASLLVIRESCVKVGTAAAFSVGIIMLVYLPLMALEGVEGRMFRPMAITVAIALGVALLFSLTTFPAAVALIYRKPVLHHSEYWDKLTINYSKFLDFSMNNKKKIIFSAIACFFISILLSFTLGSEFVPRIDEGELAIDIKRLPSTGINTSRDLNLEIERELLKIPEVISSVSRMGRGESAAEPVGSDEGEIMVKLKPKSEWESADNLESMMSFLKNHILQKVPSSYISISQPIENRVNALLAGSKADLVIKIYGNDLKELKNYADKISEIIRPIEGAGDLRVQRILGLPLMEIKPNRQKLARYGVSMDEILMVTQTLRVGANAGKVFENFKRFDLVIRLDVDSSNKNYVGDIPVTSENRNVVPLDLVADIKLEEGPAAIYREALQRRIFVEVNVRGRDLVGFVEEVQLKTKDYISKLPKGIRVEWGGQFENFTRAKNRLMLVVPIAILIIFGMLIAAFGSVFYAMGVFIVVPLAVMGGIFSLFMRGLPFSIPAGVGFIAVSGIAVLNGVVYASILKQRIDAGQGPEKSVIIAALESLRPVMTTETVALIGFIPMALSGSSGAEVQKPLAAVVVGGIISSTILAIFVLP
ncbi:MAG: efflux RND transporter permease subunit, partial [Spirochaetia bacterium]|nr:efflux RND transporter permease subunit [Spirochaetia bacterium]